MAVAKIADNFDRATNLHLNPTDFEREIHIRWPMAGSITSLLEFEAMYVKWQNYSYRCYYL